MPDLKLQTVRDIVALSIPSTGLHGCATCSGPQLGRSTWEDCLLTAHGLADGGAQLILAVPKITQLQHWSL